MKALPLQAICFDLGSTLWDDYPTELHHWEWLVTAFARHGIVTTLPQLVEMSERVVHSYSPSLTRSMVWLTVGCERELYQSIIDELIANSLDLFKDADAFRRLNPLFPGVVEMLERLAARLPLAVISQNFAEAEQWMEWHGIARYFRHISLSYRDKLFKPDIRLYERTCAALGTDPAHCMMVGDRLDNDIWPANRLGMHTVRVLADPFRIQQPRYHADEPDFTIATVAELEQVVQVLESRS